MKKIMYSILAIGALASFKTSTEACESLALFKEGTQATMTSYNDKGDETGKTVTIYSKITSTGKGTNVTATQENFDKKGKSSGKNDFTIRCESGSLFFDMKMFIPQQQADATKDMQVTMDGNDMEIPAVLSEGMTLKDSEVTMKVSMNGTPMPMMNTSIKTTNRKVEKKESVTTSAGTFDCFKITSDMEIKSVMKTSIKATTWFSTEAGVVKTESYKENGKFAGKSELTEFKK